MKKIILFILLLLTIQALHASEVKLNIHRGWNLVTSAAIDYNTSKSTCANLGFWIYDPATHKYISNKDTRFSTLKNNLQNKAIWIRAISACTIYTNVEDSISDITLVPGWNLITIQPFMLNYTLADLDKNKAIVAQYFYNTDESRWERLVSNYTFTDYDVGKGLAVYAKTTGKISTKKETYALTQNIDTNAIAQVRYPIYIPSQVRVGLTGIFNYVDSNVDMRTYTVDTVELSESDTLAIHDDLAHEDQNKTITVQKIYSDENEEYYATLQLPGADDVNIQKGECTTFDGALNHPICAYDVYYDAQGWKFIDLQYYRIKHVNLKKGESTFVEDFAGTNYSIEYSDYKLSISGNRAKMHISQKQSASSAELELRAGEYATTTIGTYKIEIYLENINITEGERWQELAPLDLGDVGTWVEKTGTYTLTFSDIQTVDNELRAKLVLAKGNMVWEHYFKEGEKYDFGVLAEPVWVSRIEAIPAYTDYRTYKMPAGYTLNIADATGAYRLTFVGATTDTNCIGGYFIFEDRKLNRTDKIICTDESTTFSPMHTQVTLQRIYWGE